LQQLTRSLYAMAIVGESGLASPRASGMTRL
jgi:hypothetical protein